jgi:RNA recognition motif-containing protein
VTKWNGKSKGCAYVDFATDEEAGAAVMGADGAEIRGNPLIRAFFDLKMKFKVEKLPFS